MSDCEQMFSSLERVVAICPDDSPLAKHLFAKKSGFKTLRHIYDCKLFKVSKVIMKNIMPTSLNLARLTST